MGTNSKIEYVNHSLGLWIGCTPLPRPGCDNCYAASGMKRWGLNPHKVVRTSKATWRQPLVRERATGQYKWKSGDYVFVCSWSDFFHPKVDKWRTEAWDLMRKRPDLKWVIVTKRIERAEHWMPVNWNWPNRTLVLSVENQEIADSEIPKLLQLKAQFLNVTLAVSIEPMLGKIDLKWNLVYPSERCSSHIRNEPPRKGINWVVVGCESKGGALGRLGEFKTPKEWLDAAIRLVNQVREAGGAPFVKQVPSLDGKLVKKMEEFPKELQFQEYPDV